MALQIIWENPSPGTLVLRNTSVRITYEDVNPPFFAVHYGERVLRQFVTLKEAREFATERAVELSDMGLL